MLDWDPEANDLFLRALGIPEADDRRRFLDEACAAKPDVRGRVEALIRSHERAGEFLAQPILEPASGPTPGGDATRTGPSSAGEIGLDFLAPSDKAGSLGRLGRLGHYEIQAAIGQGGMGIVLKAFDGNLHRVVAIKVMAPQLATSATARQRFTREARAQAAVAHEHVVTIHAVEEANGLPYIVMQYIAGTSLQDRLNRDGPLRLQEVLRISVQAAAGLAAAHKQGLVHRDVKPANILLENGVERVKLTDFGLARAADDASLTASGQVAGTPLYMSPEQAEGKPVDARSDLFSLGSVLYTISAGRPPFRAASSMAVLKRVCEDTYEVLQVLGQSGFGIVFRAFDEVLHRVVAVKVLSPQMAATSPARKRFLREARSSAQVRHENVVQVYEVGEQPLPYIAMEFIPGETLQQRLDRVGPVDPAEVVRIGRQIAEGLAAAHSNDLIHRDIKPGNVLLEGGAQRVKITDFGLARAADDASISQSGIIAGTPMYMAPEQAKGETLDQRADLFSLGSVLYQMAAGRSPFRANSTVAVLKRVAEDTPRPIRESIPETPQWLCDIIAKLHAKNPDDRYLSAREVADVLADCETQLKAHAKLKDYSRIPRSKSAAGRRSGKWIWVGVAAVLLAAIAVAMAFNWPKGGDGVRPLVNPPVVPGADKDGWVQLFNGKDLTGWKKHPSKPGFWRVDDKGILVGEGPVDFGFLTTERDDFENFHLRVEAQVDTPQSDSGVFFRIASDVVPDAVFDEVNICCDPARPKEQTGSLLAHQPPKKDLWVSAATVLAAPKEWFTLEIIARGEDVITKVNGKLALETRTPSGNRRGHFSLQQCGGQTTVRFRKIEIKELPPTHGSFKYGEPEYTNSLGMKFKLIPAGKFTMGSSQEEIDRRLKLVVEEWKKDILRGEGPDHEVDITRPFYMGTTEVTVRQFRQFGDEAGNPADVRWRNPGFEQTDNHPVVCVSWQNAVDFCNWLSKKEGKKYRLPTEAEWEYCCRAGKSGTRYCFGDDEAQLENYAWFATNSGSGKHPVGKKKPNDWGLYDMHGNAWEWCGDYYDRDYYKKSPIKDPIGPDVSEKRVLRGGAWNPAVDLSPRERTSICRAGFRLPSPAGVWDKDVGFRVVLVSPPDGVGTESEAKGKPARAAVAPFTDGDVKRIAALPAAEQVEEVRKEMKRRNPGFDGMMETKIEGGVVTEFKIVTDKVTDISPIRVFDALRVLECTGTRTNNVPNGQLADLTPLKDMNLSALTFLVLWNTKVGDAGMAYFKDCNGLTGLGLNCTNVSDAGLVHFKNCKNLTRLGLERTKVSDVGLANLKECKNLIILWLADSRVSDEGMAHFQDCKALTDLSLAGTKVSDVGVAHFKDCKNLKHLYLDRTQVGDAGLANFKGMRLMALNIDDTAITDLTSLQGMPLEHIHLTPKKITRGLDILRDMKNLKSIGIRWDQGWPPAEFWERYDKGEFK